jgi:hypothetical protein
VIATVVVQLFGRHWTKKDLATQREVTKEDLEEQRKQVDKTLAQRVSSWTGRLLSSGPGC